MPTTRSTRSTSSCRPKGEVYTLSFDAQSRPGVAVGEQHDRNPLDGVVVGKVDPTDRWKTFTYEVTGTGGKDRLAFREEGGDNNGYGAARQRDRRAEGWPAQPL